MALMPKDKRVLAALRDPEVLALMRKDSDFAQYFDAQGHFQIDVSEPTAMDRIRMGLWRLFR